MAGRGGVQCVILGGGGHASVLIDILRASGSPVSLAILDRDPSLWGKDLLGVPILGGDDLLPKLADGGATQFLVGVGSVGDNRPRRLLYDLALAHGMTPLTVRHPAATCSPSAKVGDGSAIFPGAVVNANAVLGVNVIVNTGAIVEHDCVVGDHTHVATGSRLCSTVSVGTGAHIGAGATIRQCVAVGEGAVVGAGAVVVKDVDPWTVVVGVPARLLERHKADAPYVASAARRGRG
jgi:sugar O-acyltransferase (sialic acid O-acetyltransferase NeuD family)